MSIAKDSFWDSGGAGESQLDPAQYHDPSEELLPLSHATTAAVLPTGFAGARGTIIRRSTMGGAPLGFDPNGVSIRVNVDPDIPGQGFVIDPTRISEAMALAVVQEEGVGQASTIEELRYRASNAMQRFAINEKVATVPDSRRQPRHSPIAMPGVYVVPEATQGGGQLAPAQNTIQPYSAQGIQTKPAAKRDQMAKHSQLQGFAPDTPRSNISVQQAQPEVVQQAPRQETVVQRPASLFASMAKQPKLQAAAHSNGDTAVPPTYKVTIEVKDSPISMDTWFHEVIRNEQVLALCYDLRTIGCTRTRLRTQQEDLAIHVEGSDSIYICTDPGITFNHRNEEIAIYLIKAEHPVHPQNDGPQMPNLL